jgi:hypothetical protein
MHAGGLRASEAPSPPNPQRQARGLHGLRKPARSSRVAATIRESETPTYCGSGKVRASTTIGTFAVGQFRGGTDALQGYEATGEKRETDEGRDVNLGLTGRG